MEHVVDERVVRGTCWSWWYARWSESRGGGGEWQWSGDATLSATQECSTQRHTLTTALGDCHYQLLDSCQSLQLFLSYLIFSMVFSMVSLLHTLNY